MSTGRQQTYERGTLRVTYDPSVCTHAAACVRGLPAVFRPQERRWIQLEHADAADIIAAVARCPSGALGAHVVEETPGPDASSPAISAAPAPAAPPAAAAPGVSAEAGVVITLSTRGPLIVAGPVTIKTADGEVVARQAKSALCRCGHTGNAPFCDGSHQRVGFSPTR